jgi:hypothetical protein
MMMKEGNTEMTELEKNIRYMLINKENVLLDEYLKKYRAREEGSVDGSIAQLVAMGLRAFAAGEK